MKQISAGVIIINNEGKVLGCIPSGKEKMNCNFCDIPKGRIEIGESPIEAAIRETFEETGIDLTNVKLTNLGQYPYLKNKDLHLFRCNLNVDIQKLKCTSYFEFNGKQIPEIVNYIWVDKEKIKDIYYKSLYPLILDNYK